MNGSLVYIVLKEQRTLDGFTYEAEREYPVTPELAAQLRATFPRVFGLAGSGEWFAPDEPEEAVTITVEEPEVRPTRRRNKK